MDLSKQGRRVAWRWLPFSAAALLSIAASALAPLGRKAFFIDPDLGWHALAFSFAKEPHVGAAALLALLAVVATGRRRLRLAFMLTMATGACWELGQATVIGHTGRLADLAPDALGAFAGCVWGAIVMRLVEAGRADLALGQPYAVVRMNIK